MPMLFPTSEGRARLAPIGVAGTRQLRMIAANGVRLHLPYQLDWRLDGCLDPHGFHILAAKEVLDATGFDEQIIRTSAELKFVGTSAPFEIILDLRMRDYVALEPAERDPFGHAPRQGTTLDARIGDLVPDEFTPPTGQT